MRRHFRTIQQTTTADGQGRRPSPGHNFPTEGQYDPRRGAAAYAPNVALFGSLTAPAIILFFQGKPQNGVFPPSLQSLTVGLLVIGLIGSLVGSYALAAIGAENDPTANIVPATMYAAVSVVTSLLSVVGAFEVLVAVYLPKSSTLFVILIAAASVFGVMATVFAIGDSSSLGPKDPAVRARWLRQSNVWLRDREDAYRLVWKFAVAGIVPILSALAIRLSAPSIVPDHSQVITDVVVSVGMGFAFLGSLLSLNRTAHATKGKPQLALRPAEAVATTFAVSAIAVVLVLLLPASGR